MKLSRSIISLSLIFLFCLSQNLHSESRRDVVGYWTFNLNPGFNLVAFPVLPDVSTPQVVFGDRFGSIEITTWDKGLERYRWARYNSKLGDWSGDLFLLDRGVAYWINLIDAVDPQRLVVTGHPELYRKFRWSSLENGWNFYAPTYGRVQSFDDLRPDNLEDMLLCWNYARERFELAEAAAGRAWRSSSFDRIDPDQAYLIYLKGRLHNSTGLSTRMESLYEDIYGKSDNAGVDYVGNERTIYDVPPRPLIVSNNIGLPVRLPGGGICDGEFSVDIIREGLRIGVGGQLEPDPQIIDRHSIPSGYAESGHFRLPLTISEEDDTQLQSGDRVYLLVKQNGAETRSTSIEIDDEVWFVCNLSFPEPMSAPGQVPVTPSSFTLGKPFPNPFNDRFQINVSLPETTPIKYTIYDLRGRAVQSNVLPLSAGNHRLNFSGQELSAGIFLLEVAYGQQSKVVKIAYVK
ncbi:MAG: T9SS type A sorting domain-containing protein [Candidatus Hatepunaea meridiana]|nr:T9SS type A sorting domain-containing protein [Candidatus Hatepunaea meridiana]